MGVALFMMVLAALDSLTRGYVALPALVPPFGASVVIVFFTPESPVGRPKNVLVGQTVSALAASTVLFALPSAPVGIQAALAVTCAGILMLATRSFHPPGGATALLAVVADRKLGFVMVLCPMLVGAVALVSTRYVFDWMIARHLSGRLAQANRAASVELVESIRPAAPVATD